MIAISPHAPFHAPFVPKLNFSGQQVSPEVATNEAIVTHADVRKARIRFFGAPIAFIGCLSSLIVGVGLLSRYELFLKLPSSVSKVQNALYRVENNWLLSNKLTDLPPTIQQQQEQINKQQEQLDIENLLTTLNAQGQPSDHNELSFSSDTDRFVMVQRQIDTIGPYSEWREDKVAKLLTSHRILKQLVPNITPSQSLRLQEAAKTFILQRNSLTNAHNKQDNIAFCLGFPLFLMGGIFLLVGSSSTGRWGAETRATDRQLYAQLQKTLKEQSKIPAVSLLRGTNASKAPNELLHSVVDEPKPDQLLRPTQEGPLSPQEQRALAARGESSDGHCEETLPIHT